MPTLDGRIDDLVAGDAIQITRTITGIPSGQLLTDAWLTVKEHPDDTDAAAVFQKAITTSEVAGTGQITENGSGGTPAVRFDIKMADSLLLAPGRDYFYDIQVKTDDATLNIYTPEAGRIRTVRSRTAATS